MLRIYFLQQWFNLGDPTVHSFAATPANVHDSHLLPELLHGDETRVWGNAGRASPNVSKTSIAAKPASGLGLSTPST
jgi:IS5 family transposase